MRRFVLACGVFHRYETGGCRQVARPLHLIPKTRNSLLSCHRLRISESSKQKPTDKYQKMKSIRRIKEDCLPAFGHAVRFGSRIFVVMGVALAGTVLAGTNKPEISVQQPAGSEMKDGVAKRSFGTISMGNISGSKVFRIKNKGYADLTGLRVTKIGANVSDFVVGPLNVVRLGPGASALFKVQFKPTAKGPRKAALRISSNDANENPFDIIVTGEGVKRSGNP